MEVKVSREEREILKEFIDCKIPSLVKDNLYDYKHDLMECYEEMFNSAHSLINGYKIRNEEIHCVFEEEFISLLEILGNNIGLNKFCSLSKRTVEIMK
jgi:hypothetical protein